MPDSSRWHKSALWLCIALLALQMLMTRITSAYTHEISYVFQVLAPLLAAAAALRHLCLSGSRMRIHWALVSMALLLWSIGMAMSAMADLEKQTSGTLAFGAYFAFFFYGVPMLLAISAPRDGESSRLFLVLDVIEAIIAGCLAYLALFSALPFEDKPVIAISDVLLAHTFNVENVGIAIAATLRLVSCRRKTCQRDFYRMLSIYLWAYAVLAGFYNFMDVYAPQVTHSPGTAMDLTITSSFLLLTVLIVRQRQYFTTEPLAARQSSFEIFIDTGSGIFFTLAILALGVPVAHRRFAIGMGGVVAALLLYALRTTVLQSRYVHSQQDLQEARDRLEQLSLQDGLTGVANRRAFDQALRQEWLRADRSLEPLSLLIIDVDYFKRLNDNYGHLWGDECLVLIAQTLQATLTRAGDLLARYGGEEFAAVLPSTNLDGALAVAEKMSVAVARLALPNPTEIGEFVSISIGASTCTHAADSAPIQLVEAADQSLYKAKQSGRNRTESFVL